MDYNCIRAVMHDAAQVTQVVRSRLSFTSALVRVPLWCTRDTRSDTLLEWFLSYRPLLQDLACDSNPYRPGWVEPRVVKRRPKPFPHMQ